MEEREKAVSAAGAPSFDFRKSVAHLTHVPCFRDSLLSGMGSGLGLGIARYFYRPNVLVSCNWAVGCFVVVSAGTWNWCLARRREKDIQIQHAVDLMNRKEARKAAVKAAEEKKK